VRSVEESVPRYAALVTRQNFDDEGTAACRPVKSGIMDSMKIIRNIIIVLALSSVALATSACPDKKGPAEKAGEKIDRAVDKTKDAAKDATK
jgi:hypothetical protein